MLRRIALFAALPLLIPLFACAGTQTYTTPGTYTFAIPANYGSVTVKVWGGGGGGGSNAGRDIPAAEGKDGGNSSFNSTLIAHGGGGGKTGPDLSNTSGGAGGTASGGDINTSGEAGGNGQGFQDTTIGGDGGDSPNGGQGGAGAPTWKATAQGGTAPGGGGGATSLSGGGGGGGYASKTYAAGALPATVNVVVGGGGAGGDEMIGIGSMGGYIPPGGVGAPGRIEITWVDGAAPPPPVAAQCSVTFDENPIGSGDSTTIRWTSTGGEWMYINSIGFVQGSGSASVQPSQTTNYDGSVGHTEGGSDITDATCTATLTVDDTNDAGDPPGNSSCPLGYTGTQPNCVFSGCPQGYELQGGQCVPIQGPQCAPFYCVGDDLYANDAQCTGSLVRSCSFGCAAGACIPEPPGSGNITARPTLVSKNSTSLITWTTADMEPDSCSVVEDNPSINDVGTGENSSLMSSPLDRKTVYTLICTDRRGDIFTDTATVQILPSFQEI